MDKFSIQMDEDFFVPPCVILFGHTVLEVLRLLLFSSDMYITCALKEVGSDSSFFVVSSSFSSPPLFFSRMNNEKDCIYIYALSETDC